MRAERPGTNLGVLDLLREDRFKQLKNITVFAQIYLNMENIENMECDPVEHIYITQGTPEVTTDTDSDPEMGKSDDIKSNMARWEMPYKLEV